MVIRTCYAREGYQCILKCFRAKSYDACTSVCSLISEGPTGLVWWGKHTRMSHLKFSHGHGKENSLNSLSQ